MKPRRLDGSPVITGRSKGPNNTERTCLRRSRRRRTGERFTWTLFAPFVLTSASTSTLPSRVWNSPRTNPDDAPWRTSGSLALARGLCSAYRKCMPSRRLVFPSPLAPTATRSPSGIGFSLVWAWLRKSRSSTQRSNIAAGYAAAEGLRNGRREPHRHHEVREPAALAVHDAGLQPVADVELDRLPHRRGEPVDQVLRVERDGEVLALVSRLDRLDGLAEIRRTRGELHAERVELHPHRRRVAREEADAAHRVEQLLAREHAPAL